MVILEILTLHDPRLSKKSQTCDMGSSCWLFYVVLGAGVVVSVVLSTLFYLTLQLG